MIEFLIEKLWHCEIGVEPGFLSAMGRDGNPLVKYDDSDEWRSVSKVIDVTAIEPYDEKSEWTSIAWTAPTYEMIDRPLKRFLKWIWGTK